MKKSFTCSSFRALLYLSSGSACSITAQTIVTSVTSYKVWGFNQWFYYGVSSDSPNLNRAKSSDFLSKNRPQIRITIKSWNLWSERNHCLNYCVSVSLSAQVADSPKLQVSLSTPTSGSALGWELLPVNRCEIWNVMWDG